MLPKPGKLLLALAAVVGLARPARAQIDTLEAPPATRGIRWGAPFVQVTGANALIASYNKWISQAHYGQISLATARRNLGGGMVWDADNFVVNQMGHPYQGGLYYSSARHFGHGYLAGTGFAALGSLQWEYLLETEPPAVNDFITTSLGGAMLGEMTWRLAHGILDPRARGGERFAREAVAGLVNPILGFNRLLDGSAWRVEGRHGEAPRRKSPFLYRVATGAVLGFDSEGTKTGETEDGVETVPKATTEILLWYGDEAAARRPFDFFLVNIGVNVVRDPIASVYARALLGSLPIFSSPSGDDYGMLTLGQNFDYIHSGIYKIGASGIGGGYSQRFRWGDRWYHLFQVMAGGITLGGASSEFFRRGERDYNLGPGAFSTTRMVVGRYGWGHAALNLDRYWIYTLSGIHGHELIGIGMLELSKSLYRSVGSILSYTFYDRTARYANHPTQSRLNQEARFALNYGFQ